MALVVLPEGTQVSGSIGGTTWSHNRYGAYKRNRSVPVNPNTGRQVLVRNAVRGLMIRWNNVLTQAERDAWDVYAANVTWLNKLGQSVNLTGGAHYIRSNVPRIQAAGVGAIVDVAPVIFNLATAEQTLGCTASEATQQASVTFDNTQPWANEDDGYQFVFGGLPKNASINFFRSPYRYMDSIDGDALAAPVSPQLINWPWPFAQGNQLWLKTRVSRADGRLSQWAQVNFLALA